MSIHATDAIVLRSYPYRETSVIISCLTQRYGRLKGLVKGLRRQPNRHRSQMEPMTVNRIIFYDTSASQLHLISSCELLDPLNGLEQDVDRLRLAARCVEVVEHALPLEEPQPASYQLLKQTLEDAAEGREALQTLRVHFIVRLLRLAGFQPQLDQCTGCSAHATAPAYWSTRHGGLLCARCLHEDPDAELADAQFLDTVEQLSEADRPMALAQPTAARVCHRLDGFLSWHLDHSLKTPPAHYSSPV